MPTSIITASNFRLTMA
jgi:hypothetical protein